MPVVLSAVPTIGRVHIRRALLLFAIVLGLAALAASVSRPRDEKAENPPAQAQPPATETESTPSAEPGREVLPPAGSPDTVSFDAGAKERLRLEPGRAASVEVAVDRPGLVAIPDLGLSESAAPLTPARFDLLASEGRYPIIFAPADGDEERPAGTLVVAERG